MLILGIAFTVGGLAIAVLARSIAIANDSKGPKWVRDFSLHGPDQARPGRTTPALVRSIGIGLALAGLAIVAAALT